MSFWASTKPFDWKPYLGKRVLVTLGSGCHPTDVIVREVSPKGRVLFEMTGGLRMGWYEADRYSFLEELTDEATIFK